MTRSSPPPTIMGRLNEIRAFAIFAIPIIGGIFTALMWIHQADIAHAIKHAAVDSRLDRVEAANTAAAKQREDMARDIRGIMIAVGAERATREALHSTPTHPQQSHGDTTHDDHP